MNGQIDDARCVATTIVPQVQSYTASAKRDKPKAEKSAKQTSGIDPAKGWFGLQGTNRHSNFDRKSGPLLGPLLGPLSSKTILKLSDPDA